MKHCLRQYEALAMLARSRSLATSMKRSANFLCPKALHGRSLLHAPAARLMRPCRASLFIIVKRELEMKYCLRQYEALAMLARCRSLATSMKRSANFLCPKALHRRSLLHAPAARLMRHCRASLKKSNSQELDFFWWGKLDSDQRSQ